jgi:triacylglycerol esterase/lipase EstA (alpha/beta hydrolase family)
MLPMWLLALLLLCAEFLVYGVWLVWPAAQRGDVWGTVAWMVGLPLTARLIVTLASYALSRWKGVALAPSQRLGAIAWLKFFAIEYWHLCIQNLLLIPFRVMFHTGSERGTGPATGRVVLLQHGYVNNGAVWFFTARALETRGFRVFTIDQPAFAPIDVMGDRLAARIAEVLAATGASQLTLVAHSMGGLVCRGYLRRHGDAKVDRLVTMGSPHHGTFHAYLASGPNGAQMRPGNAWLATLNKTRITVPFTSIYSVHDTIISPQDSSVMIEADNVALMAVGHVSMPSGAVARAALLAVLQK